MFRGSLSKIFIIFGIYCILSAVAFVSSSNIMKAFFVSLAMFFAAVLLFYDNKIKSTFDLKNKLKSLKSVEEHPDVKKYEENISNEIDKVEAQKHQLKKKLDILIYIFVGVLVADLLISFFSDNTYLRDELENIHRDDNCGEFCYAAEYFNITDYKKPFVTISPLSSSLANLEIFIVDINTGGDNKAGDCLAGYRFKTPEISGATQGEKYLLTFTDDKGNPSNLTYKFIVGDPITTVRISNNDTTALNITNYINNHHNELRFKVEKFEEKE